MDLQEFLNTHGVSKYKLSKISGVPGTTILDICAGRSEIERCSAGTVQRIAKALDCTMEEIMALSSPCDPDTGLPKDDSYLECDLPTWLQESIELMEDVWKRVDGGEQYLRWDCYYCNLQTDINNAEVNGIISPERAWHLREKYLRLERMS